MCNYRQSHLMWALPSQLTYVPNNGPSVLGKDEGGGDRCWYDILHPVYWTSVEIVNEQPSYTYIVLCEPVITCERRACGPHSTQSCFLSPH